MKTIINNKYNKNSLQLLFLAITVFVSISSCTKETTDNNEAEDVVVVESFLTRGNEVIITLSKMIPYSEDGYTGTLTIENAEVYIKHNGTDYLLPPVTGEVGKYLCLDPNLKIIENNLYELQFVYNELSITSNTIVPLKPAHAYLSDALFETESMVPGIPSGTLIDPVTIYWDAPNNYFHQIIVEYLETTYDPINEGLDESSFDDFQKISSDPISGNSYDLDTRRSLLFFGSYRIIIHKVNEEYVNLYENISQSSLNMTEPLTNINNGLGIFTSTNSDTLYLEVKEI